MQIFNDDHDDDNDDASSKRVLLHLKFIIICMLLAIRFEN